VIIGGKDMYSWRETSVFLAVRILDFLVGSGDALGAFPGAVGVVLVLVCPYGFYLFKIGMAVVVYCVVLYCSFIVIDRLISCTYVVCFVISICVWKSGVPRKKFASCTRKTFDRLITAHIIRKAL
jgi:hypothetical protein